MFINKLISFIHARRKQKTFKKFTTIIGHGHIFGRYSGVCLDDGSCKEDIIINENVWVHGQLNSQNHGKIELGKYTKLGRGTKLLAVNSIFIDDFTAIAENVVICDNNNHPVNPDFRLYMRMTPENDDSRKWKHSDNAPIIIGKNCWIGQNVRIQKGVSIGDNCIIAANSVVTKGAPANCILAGNPAKIVKTDIYQIEAPNSCARYNEYRKQKK